MGKFFQAVIASFGFVIGIPLLIIMWSSDGDADLSPEAETLKQARWACMVAVKDMLKDPGSAEWGAGSGNWYAEWPASTDADGLTTVQPRFRAKNSFGAMIESQWQCLAIGPAVIGLEEL